MFSLTSRRSAGRAAIVYAELGTRVANSDNPRNQCPCGHAKLVKQNPPPRVNSPRVKSPPALPGNQTPSRGITNGSPPPLAAEPRQRLPPSPLATGEPRRAERTAQRGSESQSLAELGQHDGTHPPKRFWGSMAASTVAHVFLLLVMALIVTSGGTDGKTLPIVMISPSEQLPEIEDVALPVLEVVDFNPSAGVDDLPDDVFDLNLIEPAEAIEITGVEEDLGSFSVPVELGDTMLAVSSHAGNLMADIAGGRSGQSGGVGGGGGFGGELGRRLAREGGRTGAVQVSLVWNNLNDIDLHVVSPSGERIFYGNERSLCGGHLDVDMNALRMSPEPVENVYWPATRAPWGTYIVMVNYYSQKDQREALTKYEVHVLVDGVQQTFRGVLSKDMGQVVVTAFDRQPGRQQAMEASPTDEFPE